MKQHVELAWSPDSEHWQRISEGTPLIPQTPAPARFGEVPYDWGCIFPSLPIISAPDSPVEIFYGAVRPMFGGDNVWKGSIRHFRRWGPG